MVVKQGDIIKINFSPTQGHEQAGYRPALVISNNTFNTHTNLLLILPITSSNNRFPLHIPLDQRTKTQGNILCEHIKSIDRNARKVKVIETAPKDLLKKVIAHVQAEFHIEE
jgi:mRNA interferase MazF